MADLPTHTQSCANYRWLVALCQPCPACEGDEPVEPATARCRSHFVIASKIDPFEFDLDGRSASSAGSQRDRIISVLD